MNREVAISLALPPEFRMAEIADGMQSQTSSGPIPGWIYCLCNDSMPDLVKVGLTKNSVEERMRQLDTTGVATPFKIVHQWLSADIVRDEQNLHKLLDKFRVRSNREWFRVPKDKRQNLVVFVNRYMLKANGRFYRLETELQKDTHLSVGEMILWAQTKLGLGLATQPSVQTNAKSAKAGKKLGLGSWLVITLIALAIIGAAAGR